MDVRDEAIKVSGRRCCNCGEYIDFSLKILRTEGKKHTKVIDKRKQLAENPYNYMVLCRVCLVKYKYRDEKPMTPEFYAHIELRKEGMAKGWFTNKATIMVFKDFIHTKRYDRDESYMYSLKSGWELSAQLDGSMLDDIHCKEDAEKLISNLQDWKYTKQSDDGECIYNRDWD